MDGIRRSKLICMATKGLRNRYKILRQQVRIHNKDLKNKKETKVTAKAIRKYNRYNHIRKAAQTQTATTKYG
ncbi:MAG: hypothetical protein WCR36_06575 [Bacteroidaceae bacterium]